MTSSLWALTDTDWSASWPAVILFTDSHWHPNETKSWVTLIDNTAAIVIILPDNLSIYYGLRGATMSSCGWMKKKKVKCWSSHVGILILSGGGLTQTLDLRATPKPIGHTLSYPGAHQGISCVAGEDGSGSIYSESSNLVAIWWSSKVTAGNDWDKKEIMFYKS